MVTNGNLKNSSRRTKRTRGCLVALLSCVLFTGCATTNFENRQSEAELDVVIKQADDEVTKGRRDQAITLLNQAAKENPTSVAPWLKISTIWFEAGNYPSSILAANEVVQRDSSNQEAKSLLVVAGLRVAADAVKGLRSANSVNPNARAEAENLTQSLRVVLGEKVLVPGIPPEAKPHAKAKPQAKAKPVSHSKTRAVPTQTVDAPPAVAPASSEASSDPFKALK
jgi:lipopolysaccharide biosynthesis regulator YciM